MPVNIRKDDAARRIALNILGEPSVGLYDAFGNKKRYVKKKELKDAETLYQEEIDPEKIKGKAFWSGIQKKDRRW